METKWEYKVLKFPTHGFSGGKIKEDEINLQINKYGNDGWELVTTLGSNEGMGTTRDVVLFFKRQKK